MSKEIKAVICYDKNCKYPSVFRVSHRGYLIGILQDPNIFWSLASIYPHVASSCMKQSKGDMILPLAYSNFLVLNIEWCKILVAILCCVLGVLNFHFGMGVWPNMSYREQNSAKFVVLKNLFFCPIWGSGNWLKNWTFPQFSDLLSANFPKKWDFRQI